ncbi:MAG: hypothetical protein EBZ76_06900 [Synechococcaceae bacterium WB9_2_170]|nr:hypothetical protein [Synechococcaceae bacterium WB9_2_170]
MVPKIGTICPLGYVDTLNGKCSTLGLAYYTLRPTNGQAQGAALAIEGVHIPQGTNGADLGHHALGQGRWAEQGSAETKAEPRGGKTSCRRSTAAQRRSVEGLGSPQQRGDQATHGWLAIKR